MTAPIAKNAMYAPPAIAVVILVARQNKLESLLPLAPELRKVLEEVKLGEVRRVGV